MSSEDADSALERALEENRRRSEVLAQSAMRLQGARPRAQEEPTPESDEDDATRDRRDEQPGE